MLNYPDPQGNHIRYQSDSNDSKRTQLVYASAVMLVLLIAGSVSFGVRAHQRSQQVALEDSRRSSDSATPLGALAQPRDQGSPFQPGVAGVSTSGEERSGSGFGLVESAARASAPALGSSGVCQIGTLFSIGEKETSSQDNPVDELSWVDALHVLPEYSNPFVVGVNSQKDFPWRTSQENDDSTKTDVLFNYAGSSAQAQVILSWSPGKQGAKQKSVILDGSSVGQTLLRTGEFSGANWQNMPFFVDAFLVTLQPGKHTLTLTHSNDGEGEAVWDYVAVEIVGCN